MDRRISHCSKTRGGEMKTALIVAISLVVVSTLYLMFAQFHTSLCYVWQGECMKIILSESLLVSFVLVVINNQKD